MRFTGEFFIPPGHSDDTFNNHELEIEHKHRYYSILGLAKDKVVLDIASGEGYGSNMLSGYASHVYGVDINPELVAHASKTYTQKNISFLHGSVDAIPLPNQSIDMVVSFETLEHVSAETQVAFLAEAKRVLKPNGVMVISTPEKKNYTERYDHHNEFHVHELHKDEFINLLKKSFAHVNIFDQGFEVTSLILNKTTWLNESPLSIYKIDDSAYNFEGKYLIGVCSDTFENTQVPLAGIIPESERSYFSLIDRTLKLQKEVEKLGAWGKSSSEEIDALRKRIGELQQHTEDLGAWGRRSNEEIDRLRERIKTLQQQVDELTAKEQSQQLLLSEKSEEVNKLTSQIAELESLKKTHSKPNTEQERLEKNLQKTFKTNYSLKRDLERKQRQIATLESSKKELESRLGDIYASDGWKLLSKYYNFKGKYLPEGSKTYALLRSVARLLKPGKWRKRSVEMAAAVPAAQTEKKFIPTVPDNISFPLALPVFEQPLVSIIIPAFNNWAFTRNCIISIYQHTNDVPYEIIVGDNVSTDETINLEKYFRNVNYLRNKENLGYI